MNGKKPSFSMLESTYLLSLLPVGYILLLGSSVFMLWTEYTSDPINPKDITGVWIGFAFTCLVVIGITLLVLPKAYCKLTFTSDTIRIKRALHKPVCHSYDYYSYVYRATYWHGSPVGIGYFPQFLVLSHRFLRQNELNGINEVPDGVDQVIKIRLTKRRYRKMLPALPPYLRHMAESYWSKQFGEKK